MLKYIPKDIEPHHIYMDELTSKLINERAKRNTNSFKPIKKQNPFDKKRITK